MTYKGEEERYDIKHSQHTTPLYMPTSRHGHGPGRPLGETREGGRPAAPVVRAAGVGSERGVRDPIPLSGRGRGRHQPTRGMTSEKMKRRRRKLKRKGEGMS